MSKVAVPAGHATNCERANVLHNSLFGNIAQERDRSIFKATFPLIFKLNTSHVSQSHAPFVLLGLVSWQEPDCGTVMEPGLCGLFWRTCFSQDRIPRLSRNGRRFIQGYAGQRAVFSKPRSAVRVAHHMSVCQEGSTEPECGRIPIRACHG